MKNIKLIIASMLLSSMSSVISQTYHEDDKEGLRIFLRQPSAEAGKINGEQLGLQISDTLDWQSSEAWVAKIKGIEWDTVLPKRLIGICTEIYDLTYGWSGCNLAGTLDASKWGELIVLSCIGNQLTVLDVSANTGLRWLECDYNFLTTLYSSANIRTLYCGNNPLTKLDLSANTELMELLCDNNQLTELDVSANIKLRYLNCERNLLTKLNVSTNVVLRELWCNDNQLNTLDVSGATGLTWIKCHNNRLPLSELFAVSERVIERGRKYLGTQNLLLQAVTINSEIDYSDQNIFDGIYTQFTVTQNGEHVPSNDYTLIDGKITFKRPGNYTITMTNEAILSRTDYPAQVVAKIEVDDVAVLEVAQNNIKVSPNPVNYELRITNYELRDVDYTIYSIMGQIILQGKLQDSAIIKVKSLANGVYYLRINNKVMKFVKE